MNEIIKKIKSYLCPLITKYLKFEDSYLKDRKKNPNRKFLLRGIAILLILLSLLFLIMLLVMIVPFADHIFMHFTGTETKLELIKLIGWGMSGIIATLVVFGLFQRAAALEGQNKIAGRGHVQERFKVAIEHLSNENTSIRIASFYEFYRLAKAETYLQKAILDILCVYLRQITKNEDYQKKQIKPTEEVQILLNVLFKPNDKGKFIFIDKSADLEEVYLQGTNLQHADLRYANLQGAQLQNAQLQETKLQNANLQGVNLQGANLQGAQRHESIEMPDGWKDIVVKDNDGKTGLVIMNDKGEVIERL